MGLARSLGNPSRCHHFAYRHRQRVSTIGGFKYLSRHRWLRPADGRMVGVVCRSFAPRCRHRLATSYGLMHPTRLNGRFFYLRQRAPTRLVARPTRGTWAAQFAHLSPRPQPAPVARHRAVWHDSRDPTRTTQATPHADAAPIPQHH